MVWSCFPNPKLNVSLYAMHVGECGEGSAPAGIVGECHLSGLRTLLANFPRDERCHSRDGEGHDTVVGCVHESFRDEVGP